MQCVRQPRSDNTRRPLQIREEEEKEVFGYSSTTVDCWIFCCLINRGGNLVCRQKEKKTEYVSLYIYWIYVSARHPFFYRN